MNGLESRSLGVWVAADGRGMIVDWRPSLALMMLKFGFSSPSLRKLQPLMGFPLFSLIVDVGLRLDQDGQVACRCRGEDPLVARSPPSW